MKKQLLAILIVISCCFISACTPRQPTPSSTPTEVVQENAESISIIEEFGTAWTNQDTDNLLPLYSKDVVALDADSYGHSYNYSTVAFAMSLVKSGDFYFEMTSFFVTGDGRFAALIGPWWTHHIDEYTAVPAMTLVEIDAGSVVWEYDYYGSAMSQTYTLPEIPLEASKVRASENQMAQISELLSNWVSANNKQDLEFIAQFYAENASIILMADPEWVIQTKNQLLSHLGEAFADKTVTATLGDTFVSANGQYVAVQGELLIADKHPQPFIMLLEIENGKIIMQYIFLSNQLYYEFFT